MTKNSKNILFILIILLLGLFIFYYFSRSKSPPPLPPAGLTEAEKENAARIMNQQLENVPPLTEKQKEDIAKKMMKN